MQANQILPCSRRVIDLSAVSLEDPKLRTELDKNKRPPLIFNPSRGNWQLPFECLVGRLIDEHASLAQLYGEKTTSDSSSAVIASCQRWALNQVRNYLTDQAVLLNFDPELAQLIESVELLPSRAAAGVVPWLDFAVSASGSTANSELEKIDLALTGLLRRDFDYLLSPEYGQL